MVHASNPSTQEAEAKSTTFEARHSYDARSSLTKLNYTRAAVVPLVVLLIAFVPPSANDGRTCPLVTGSSTSHFNIIVIEIRLC
jgi:hypothetical protein